MDMCFWLHMITPKTPCVFIFLLSVTSTLCICVSIQLQAVVDFLQGQRTNVSVMTARDGSSLHSHANCTVSKRCALWFKNYLRNTSFSKWSEWLIAWPRRNICAELSMIHASLFKIEIRFKKCSAGTNVHWNTQFSELNLLFLTKVTCEKEIVCQSVKLMKLICKRIDLQMHDPCSISLFPQTSMCDAY